MNIDFVTRYVKTINVEYSYFSYLANRLTSYNLNVLISLEFTNFSEYRSDYIFDTIRKICM